MTESEENILPPSAARLAESLRDTGYTFATSVADIVDNSVAADATRINISLDLEMGQHPVLMIADNGKGMDQDELKKAMAYGSPKRPLPATNYKLWHRNIHLKYSGLLMEVPLKRS